MKMRSITRKLIVMVLLLEFLTAIVLIGAVALYEFQVQQRAFDVMLRGRAYSLLGAVQEAADGQDNVMFDMTGLALPERDLFNVDESGRILGRSRQWPEQQVLKEPTQGRTNEVFPASVDGHRYRFIVVRGIRVIDPGAKNGGVSHPIRVIYGAPTGHLWHEVMETIRFYAVMTLLLLTATAGALSWFLSRALAPLKELAEEAAQISAQQWNFHPPKSASSTKELIPLISALEAALRRLQEAFAQQRHFTSNAAHELKTDIAIAKSSIQLLSMRPRTTEEYQQGLEVCLDDCLRLEETVQRILTLARVESAPSNLQIKDANSQISDAVVCVRESVRRFGSLAELSRSTIKVDAPEEVFVRMNESDCILLLTNLIHNALTHSKRGSVISITVRSFDLWATLEIEDHGDGIPLEALPHVFEPFYRGDNSRDRRTGGTGLGLAICKALCEGGGGSITLTSQPGSGTLVTVRLPIGTASSSTETKTVFTLTNSN